MLERDAVTTTETAVERVTERSESPEKQADRLVAEANRRFDALITRGDVLAERVALRAGTSIDETLRHELDAIAKEARHLRSALDLRPRPDGNEADVTFVAGDAESDGRVFPTRESLVLLGKTKGRKALAHELFAIHHPEYGSNLPEEWVDARHELLELFVESPEGFLAPGRIDALEDDFFAARKELRETDSEKALETIWVTKRILEANASTVGRSVADALAVLSEDASGSSSLSAEEQYTKESERYSAMRRLFRAADAMEFAMQARVADAYAGVARTFFRSDVAMFPSRTSTENESRDFRTMARVFTEYAPLVAEKDESSVSDAFARFLERRADLKVERFTVSVLRAAFDALGDGRRSDAIGAAREAFGVESPFTAAALLGSSDRALRRHGMEETRLLGIDVDDRMIDTWERCPYGKLEETILHEVEAMVGLEKERPGSTRVLREEFGIENFGKYSREQLASQFDARDDTSLPYGVVIYPKSDYNGAFGIWTGKLNEVDTISRALEETHRVRVYEAGSRTGVVRALLKTKHRYAERGGGKIAFALIGGHGTKDSVQFGDGDDMVRLRTEDLAGRGAARAGQEFFEPGATVILSSCSTGQEGGIAQKMSEALGGRVIAPDIPTRIDSMNIRTGADGRPEFDVAYHKADAAVVYQAGVRS